jgi:hypothetical protein
MTIPNPNYQACFARCQKCMTAFRWRALRRGPHRPFLARCSTPGCKSKLTRTLWPPPPGYSVSLAHPIFVTPKYVDEEDHLAAQS